jgi:murein DD-endopeptidase MepM/ murein hydrolase activator NlpD
MTQRPDSKRISRRFFSQRALLASGLSCLSGMSFLGSAGVVVAQTSPPPELPQDSPALPSAKDLLSAPEAKDPAPEVAVEPAPEAIAPVVVEPEPIPAAAPEAPVPAAEFITPEVSPGVSPADPAPAPEAASPAPLVAPDLADKARGALGDNYIDSTPYDLGATTYQAPSAVVLSERSSGCQAVIARGEALPGSVCAQLAAGGAAAGGAVAAGESGGSSYAGGYASVALGPVNFSSSGISLSGRSTPSGRDYYNLTARPSAKLGNGNGSLLFPLSIPAAITSAFGWRVHPISGESRFHSGTDIGADQGTPVLAAFSGKVQIADFMGGYGLTVVLRHNNDKEETLYGHLSELFVKPGETVKQGEVIGRVGSTGFSTGPHLHFEFRQEIEDGSWVTMDPGQALEFSLAKFITNLQVAQTKKPVTVAVVDPLQRLKVVLQEAKNAQTTKQETQALLDRAQGNRPQASAVRPSTVKLDLNQF